VGIYLGYKVPVPTGKRAMVLMLWGWVTSKELEEIYFD
jgi:hypothetical protein